MASTRKTLLTLTAAAAVTAAAACSSTATASTESKPPAVAAATSAKTGFPVTPPGAQARWLLGAAVHAPVPNAEISAHFDKSFLAQVSAAKLNAVFAGFKSLKLDVVVLSTSEYVIMTVTENGTTQVTVTLDVDSAGLISGLLLSPASAAATPAVPTTWAALDRQVKSAAPGVSLLVARVTGATCHPVQAIGATTARPLGSAFKLYVLDALARAVASGKVSWNQRLTVTSQLKSLPSGALQSEPDGTQVTVRQAADDMISASDNTAANLLMALVGRSAVEAAAKDTGLADPSRDVPFLTTRELFALKLVDWPALAQRYLAGTPAARQALLTGTVDKIPYATLTQANAAAWTGPRDIDSIEWSASPSDICGAYASLKNLAASDKNIASTLEINNGGLGLNPSQWPSVWFKGGSEPGVLTLNYLATTSGGQTYLVSVLAENPTGTISGSATEALLGAVKGAFQLAARNG